MKNAISAAQRPGGEGTVRPNTNKGPSMDFGSVKGPKPPNLNSMAKPKLPRGFGPRGK